jgi:hypothetical protein
MRLEQELRGETGASLSPLDLKQIKEAVRALRAANPRSALADLVEEKIRVIERDDPECWRELPRLPEPGLRL